MRIISNKAWIENQIFRVINSVYGWWQATESDRYSEMRPRGTADCEWRPVIVTRHQPLHPCRCCWLASLAAKIESQVVSYFGLRNRWRSWPDMFPRLHTTPLGLLVNAMTTSFSKKRRGGKEGRLLCNCRSIADQPSLRATEPWHAWFCFTWETRHFPWAPQ